MTATAETSVGDVVASDFRAAAVLERFGIDFCCGGKRTLAEACRERGVAPEIVLDDIARVTESAGNVPRFAEWTPETLIAYIVGNHHAYVQGILPVISAHTRKVAAAHGANHPELEEVARVWAGVADEMASHMAKEEQVLFPYIAAAARAVRQGGALPAALFGSIENPIRMMEDEHDSAGNAMARIRELTSGFTPPADACTTYRTCLQELAEFERDLHVHVHLENNLLFPKARDLAAREDAPVRE